jgi:hypothetical protein
MKFWKYGMFIKLSQNKGLEIEGGYNKNFCNWFNFSICSDRKMDHAGFHFDIELLGLWGDISIYDNRHWDTDNNCWIKYEI